MGLTIDDDDDDDDVCEKNIYIPSRPRSRWAALKRFGFSVLLNILFNYIVSNI